MICQNLLQNHVTPSYYLMKNNNISILHSIEDLDEYSGGPSRSVLGLVESLSAIDVDIYLFTQSFLNKNSLVPKNIKHFKNFNYQYLICKKIALPFRNGIYKFVKKKKPNLIHSHGIWLATNYWTSKVAYDFNIPHVIHTRGMLSRWSILNKNLKKKLAFFLYQKKILINASVLIATSELEYQDIRNIGLTNPVAIIPNGVSFSKEHISDDKKKSSNSVLFLSRVEKKKGLINLLYAWEKIKPQNWRLQIAGPDQDGHLDEIKIISKNLKIDQYIDYLGYINDELKEKIFRQSDLFVLPSFSENFGIVVAEAMSFGLPVITTNKTPWHDLNKFKCGWCIDIGIDSLVLALKSAFSLSDNQRLAMGERGRQYIQRYNWQNIAHDMKLTYLWTLKKIDQPSFIKVK